MAEFNSVVFHGPDGAVAGQIAALEGERGMMRLSLTAAAPVGQEGVLEMHDGVRFRVLVAAHLPDHSYRMKLLGRG